MPFYIIFIYILCIIYLFIYYIYLYIVLFIIFIYIIFTYSFSTFFFVFFLYFRCVNWFFQYLHYFIITKQIWMNLRSNNKVCIIKEEKVYSLILLDNFLLHRNEEVLIESFFIHYSLVPTMLPLLLFQ